MSDLLDSILLSYENMKKNGKYLEPPEIICLGRTLNKQLNTKAFDPDDTYIFSTAKQIKDWIDDWEKKHETP